MSFRFNTLLEDKLKNEGAKLRKGDRTKLALRAAVVRLLQDRNYHTFAIADIADTAGISRPAFYQYYDGKEEITSEALLDFIDAVPKYRPRPKAPQTAFEAVHSMNVYYVELYRQNSGLYRAIKELSDILPGLAKAGYDLDRRWSVRVLEDLGRRTGQQSLDGPAEFLVATAMGNMADGLLRDMYEDRNPHLKQFADDIDLVAQCLTFIWYRTFYLTNPPLPVDGPLARLLEIGLGPIAGVTYSEPERDQSFVTAGE